MTEHQLASLIRALHQTLASAKELDPGIREELHILAADLDRLAVGPETGGEQGEGVQARLVESVRRLEASHPELSRTLANLIDALALYGL